MDKLKVFFEVIYYKILFLKHSFDLKIFQDNTKKICKNDIILFCTLRNEKFRIDYFLRYYRGLGVKHFIFIDNDSDDDFRIAIKDEPDCSVWYTAASYKKSKFGVHWINYLIHKYGINHWCLTVDPDEILVYPHSEHRNLIELTSYLDTLKKESFFTLMLDMYSDRLISQTEYQEGQNPLEAASYFDSYGYVQHHNHHRWDMFIQGGPRRRIFFRHIPQKAPALNKTPLIKWKKNYIYVSSTHCALPKRLNRPHTPGKLSVTGCLLHFKFLSILKNKVEEELLRQEHYNNSFEYKKYADILETSTDFLYDPFISCKYVNSEQLVSINLMSKGEWF